MLKIAVCDDEFNQRQIIVQMIKNHLDFTNKQYRIWEFNSGEELLSSTLKFDMFFLDIQMNELNGIETAKKIRIINSKSIIIFITCLKDYVFDAFDVRAFHYLLKPVKQDKLNSILDSAFLLLEDEENKFIIVKTKKQSIKVLLKDILYIEINKRILKIHTTFQVIEYYYKISDIEQELIGCNFFRCHKSYIVNLKYVSSFDNIFITLENCEKILISKYKLNDFSKTFMYYLKNVE